MITKLNSLIASIRSPKVDKSNDFSDFFNKPAGAQVKVLRKVLREANEDQRKVVESAKMT